MESAACFIRFFVLCGNQWPLLQYESYKPKGNRTNTIIKIINMISYILIHIYDVSSAWFEQHALQCWEIYSFNSGDMLSSEWFMSQVLDISLKQE